MKKHNLWFYLYFICSKQGRQVLQYSTSVKKLMLVVDVTNKGRTVEDAHNAMLNVTIPPSLKYSGVRDTKLVISCQSEEMFVLCELGNPFGSNQENEIQIIFETSGITLDTQEIYSQLQLSTLSEQSNLWPLPMALMVEFTLETSFAIVQQTSLTYFSGKVMGESAMKSTNDIGSPAEFTFQVNVLGKPLGKLGTLEVEFVWPWEVANGKWLLYLTEIWVEGSSRSRCLPPHNIINPLNLTLSASKSSRRRREVDLTELEFREPQSSRKIPGPQRQFIVLNCTTGGARCVTFTCPLHNVTNVAKVIVRARVWNSTMLEDYTEAGRITVKGQATLRLVSDKPTIKMNSVTSQFTLEVDPELGEETPYEVPLWIIIVSAVAGVLLLGMLILLMWKCGFFRRASTREMYEAKAQKAEMKSQPSEKDRLTKEY